MAPPSPRYPRRLRWRVPPPPKGSPPGRTTPGLLTLGFTRSSPSWWGGGGGHDGRQPIWRHGRASQDET